MNSSDDIEEKTTDTNDLVIKEMECLFALSNTPTGNRPSEQDLRQMVAYGRKILEQTDPQDFALRGYAWIMIAESQINLMLSREAQEQRLQTLQQGMFACNQAVKTALASKSSGLICLLLSHALTIEFTVWEFASEGMPVELESILDEHTRLMDEWQATLVLDRQIGLECLAQGLLLGASLDAVDRDEDRKAVLTEAAGQLEMAAIWFRLALDESNTQRATDALRSVRQSLGAEGSPIPHFDPGPVDFWQSEQDQETLVKMRTPVQREFTPELQDIRTTSPAGSACYRCGKLLKPGKKFCGNCGAPVAQPARSQQSPAQATCPQCQGLVSPGARFCRHCGTNISA